MADGSGCTLASYFVKAKYTITERRHLLMCYRAWVADHAKTQRLSTRALSDIMDDVFSVFPHWTVVECPLFKTVYGDPLDPNTIRHYLRCELGHESVRRMHLKSFQMLDAFLKIARCHPPQYL